MREKDKIEKYLDRLIKIHNGTIVRSELSSYYSLKGRIIRVSNHIGKNSSGNFSIIFDSGNSNNYILHGHSTGNITVFTYEELKQFVKTFCKVSYIFNEFANSPSIDTIQKECITNEDLVKLLTKNFTANQLKQMEIWNKKLFKKK